MITVRSELVQIQSRKDHKHQNAQKIDVANFSSVSEYRSYRGSSGLNENLPVLSRADDQSDAICYTESELKSDSDDCSITSDFENYDSEHRSSFHSESTLTKLSIPYNRHVRVSFGDKLIISSFCNDALHTYPDASNRSDFVPSIEDIENWKASRGVSSGADLNKEKYDSNASVAIEPSVGLLRGEQPFAREHCESPFGEDRRLQVSADLSYLDWMGAIAPNDAAQSDGGRKSPRRRVRYAHQSDVVHSTVQAAQPAQPAKPAQPTSARAPTDAVRTAPAADRGAGPAPAQLTLSEAIGRALGAFWLAAQVSQRQVGGVGRACALNRNGWAAWAVEARMGSSQADSRLLMGVRIQKPCCLNSNTLLR